MNLREYIDQLRTSGYTVRGSKGEDPVLIAPDGSAVETWREDYPYDELMDRDEYEEEKYRLQIELLKFQYWTQDVGAKHIVVFEGRDAAGKGGTIKRFMEHLNPRAARVVALTKPSSTGPGTTAPVWNESWAFAPRRSTRPSCARPQPSNACSSNPV